jgi:hypothetical protein
MWARRTRSTNDFSEEIRANIGIEADRLIREGMYLQGLLFGVSPGSASTFLIVPVLLALVAAASAWLPRHESGSDSGAAIRVKSSSPDWKFRDIVPVRHAGSV